VNNSDVNFNGLYAGLLKIDTYYLELVNLCTTENKEELFTRTKRRCVTNFTLDEHSRQSVRTMKGPPRGETDKNLTFARIETRSSSSKPVSTLIEIS
jgi:hypothetical protein